MRKLFKSSLHKRKLNAETIWNFQAFMNSKKNTCRSNYMRKYGSHNVHMNLPILHLFKVVSAWKLLWPSFNFSYYAGCCKTLCFDHKRRINPPSSNICTDSSQKVIWDDFCSIYYSFKFQVGTVTTCDSSVGALQSQKMPRISTTHHPGTMGPKPFRICNWILMLKG